MVMSEEVHHVKLEVAFFHTYTVADKKKFPQRTIFLTQFTKKLARFKHNFNSVDVVSAYLLVAVISTGFFATACLNF